MQNPEIMLIARLSLHDETVARLRLMITEGELLPGARIAERELCDRFGISRTPLRAFEVVAALEGLAGELACRRIDAAALAEIEALHAEMAGHYRRGDLAAYFACNQAIHEAINRAAGNQQLSELYALVSNRVRRARYLANHSPERWAEAMREHDAILDALRRRDGPACHALLRAHLEHKLYTVTGDPDAQLV
jgi:DNA-binding GntR family transcriptional regulator